MKSDNQTFDLLCGGAGGCLLLFIALPLASVFLSTRIDALWETLRDPEVIVSIGLTFNAGLIAVAYGLITGLPLAYLLARRSFRGKTFIRAFINLPIIIPHTAAGVALLLVFGRRGLLGEWLARLGVTFTDNLGGIVVAMIFVSLPYLVNGCYEAFTLIDRELEMIALTDGATPWQAFWRVALPQARRGVAGSAVMMWARGVSEFGAIIILAYHPKVVPVLVYERFEGFGLAAAQPVALLLIISALVAFFVFHFALSPRNLTG